jgi:hypothetical protein
MVIKWPPPMPMLCAFMIELQRPEAIAASTAEPLRSRIFLVFDLKRNKIDFKILIN